MRKNYIRTALVALFFTMFAGFTVVASNAYIAKFDNIASSVLTSSNHGWKSAPAFVKPVNNKIEPKSTVLKPSENYNVIEGPDGTQWYSTQSYEILITILLVRR